MAKDLNVKHLAVFVKEMNTLDNQIVQYANAREQHV
jgi:hypothetical protein